MQKYCLDFFHGLVLCFVSLDFGLPHSEFLMEGEKVSNLINSLYL